MFYLDLNNESANLHRVGGLIFLNFTCKITENISQTPPTAATCNTTPPPPLNKMYGFVQALKKHGHIVVKFHVAVFNVCNASVRHF